MIRKSINVIDLDKTLIPYDSFRQLIKNELIKFSIGLTYISLMRVLRLISMHSYKERVMTYFDKKYSSQFFKDFASKLFLDIDEKVLRIISKETGPSTINILISASPNSFVKYLILELNWKGMGSYFDNENNFMHLYGKNKINWLEFNYSRSDYDYNFAISDSDSDDKLLAMFKKGKKWIVG